MKRESLNFSNKISKGCTKPVSKLCNDIIYGILCRKSVVLTEIARGLQEENKLCNTVDRLSNNLMNLDSDQINIIKENIDNESLRCLKDCDEYVIVANDDTDIAHEYSKKLEDLCVIRDASNKKEKYVNDYKVCEYTALSPKQKSPISLYSKIYSTVSKGFKSENDETLKGEDLVIEKLSRINKKAIFLRDRGYDINLLFVKDIKEDNKFVTRLKNNRSLIFKNEAENAYNKIKNRKGKIKTILMYKGENRECYINYTKNYVEFYIIFCKKTKRTDSKINYLILRQPLNIILYKKLHIKVLILYYFQSQNF